MTVPRGPTVSEPASLLDIQNEFVGGSAPIGLNEYYAGGAYVGNPGPTSAYQTGAIPTSGAISIGNFLGAASSFIFNDVVSSNTANYNLRARAISAGWSGSSPLYATVTINTGVYVYSTALANPAFTLGVAPPAGSTVTLTNNGIIAGLGGAGGVGGSVSGGSFTNGGNGGTGSTGLSVNYPISITNNGTIGGGGGGGGGGGASRNSAGGGPDPKAPILMSFGASGGGGGAGRARYANDGGGSGGSSSGNDADGSGSSGANGSLAAAGAGGARYVNPTVVASGAGGAGGDLGLPGTAGSAPDLGYVNGGYSNAGAGGSAGAAIIGGVNISWYAFGQRRGSIDNPGTSYVSGGLTYAAHNNVSNIGSPGSISWFSDGTMSAADDTSYSPVNWYAPTTAGIGNSYYIKFTKVSGAGAAAGGPYGSWLALSSARAISVSNPPFATTRSVYFKIELSSSPTGPAEFTENLTITTDNYA